MSQPDQKGKTAGPSPRTSRVSSVLPRSLLQGTFAALKCRELLEKGSVNEARLEHDQLVKSLGELKGLDVDPSCRREIDILTTQEQSLRDALSVVAR